MGAFPHHCPIRPWGSVRGAKVVARNRWLLAQCRNSVVDAAGVNAAREAAKDVDGTTEASKTSLTWEDNMSLKLKLVASAAGILTSAGVALADNVEFLCYQDGNECDVMAEMAAGFTAETGHTVDVVTVGYDIIRDQLESQLEAGTSVDVARVTNLGGLNKYYLDMAPYVDSAYWDENYGATLGWFRKADGSDSDAVYGWITGLTVTGPYVNVTYFDDAGVDMPAEGATWDEWLQR